AAAATALVAPAPHTTFEPALPTLRKPRSAPCRGEGPDFRRHPDVGSHYVLGSVRTNDPP
ncbi:jg4718, partial [Pararge aegeria aegeria]